MKMDEFRKELRSSLETICIERRWNVENSKQRGMAFEDWCFNLFRERYPAAENDPEECIIRTDDAGIDIFFESKETEEIYILQCKPIPFGAEANFVTAKRGSPPRILELEFSLKCGQLSAVKATFRLGLHPEHRPCTQLYEPRLTA